MEEFAFKFLYGFICNCKFLSVFSSNSFLSVLATIPQHLLLFQHQFFLQLIIGGFEFVIEGFELVDFVAEDFDGFCCSSCVFGVLGEGGRRNPFVGAEIELDGGSLGFEELLPGLLDGVGEDVLLVAGLVFGMGVHRV